MWILSEAVGSGKQGVIPVSPSAASPGSPLASALGKQWGWRLHVVLWVLRCITSFWVHPAERKSAASPGHSSPSSLPGLGETMHRLTWSTLGLGLGSTTHALVQPHTPVWSRVRSHAEWWQFVLSTSSLSVTNLHFWAQVNLQPVWHDWSLQGCSPDLLTFLWAQKQQSSYDHPQEVRCLLQGWAEVRASIQPTPWWVAEAGEVGPPPKSALPCSLCWPWNSGDFRLQTCHYSSF